MSIKAHAEVLNCNMINEVTTTLFLFLLDNVTCVDLPTSILSEVSYCLQHKFILPENKWKIVDTLKYMVPSLGDAIGIDCMKHAQLKLKAVRW